MRTVNTGLKTGMKFLGGVFALGLVGLLVIAVVAVSYDYDQLKPTLVQAVRDATGRDLKIAGKIELEVAFNPFPMPVLSVTDVKFSNAPWGRKRPMVKFERLEAKIDLLALFNGQIKVDTLAVDGLSVFLETDSKGRANWKFPLPGSQKENATPAGGLPLTPVIRNVRLRNIRVSVLDGATGKDVQFLIPNVKLSADRFRSPVFASVDADYKGVPIRVRGKFGSLEQLTGADDVTFPVRIKISFPGFSAKMNAEVKSPLGGRMSFTARVNGEATDGKALGQILGSGVPDLFPLKGRVALAGGASRYVFSDLDVQAADSTITGTGNIDFSPARPRVKIRLNARVLDLDALMGARRRSSGKSQKVPAKVFSAAPLPWALLKAADADVKINIKRIKAAGVVMTKARVRAKVTAGRLNVEDVRFALGGGRVYATLRLNAASAVPSLRVRARFAKVDVGRVLKMRGFGNVLVLPMNAQVRLSSSGVSVRRLMGNANGSIQAAARGGRIDSTAFSGLTTGVGSILPWAARKDAGTITCLVADWRLKAGIATARTVLMDTPGFRVAVSGNVDLGKEKLHLNVIPRAKTISLASFAVPVRLQGSFSTPSVNVSPEDLVVGTVKNVVNVPGNIVGDLLGAVGMGGGKKAPCVEALGGGKTKPAGRKTKTSSSVPDRGLNAVKDLGNTLSNGLNKAFKGIFGP